MGKQPWGCCSCYVWVASGPYETTYHEETSQISHGSISGNSSAGFLNRIRNRRAMAVKILVNDGQGFPLCQKHLSKGKLRAPTQNDRRTESERFCLWQGRRSRPSEDGRWSLTPSRGKRSRSNANSFCVGALGTVDSVGLLVWDTGGPYDGG